MTPSEKAHREIVEQAERLGIESIDTIIIENLSDQEFLSVSKQIDKKEAALVGLVNHPKFFSTDEVYQLTLKLLGIMEVSEDNDEFQKLLKKKNPQEKEKTDFDKLLGGIMKVPKPPNEKKKPSN